MHHYLNIASKAAIEAGSIIASNFTRLDRLSISTKQDKNYVTNVDQQSEQKIIEIIKAAYPEHAIIAEESYDVTTENNAEDKNEVAWIIDPLDGTINYMNGFPYFSISIAVMVKGKIQHAVVYDPYRGEMYKATRGEGAYLNDKRLRIISKNSLKESIFSMGFLYTRQKEDLDKYLSILKILTPSFAAMRRLGSAALNLAYIASSRIAAYYETGLQAWDIAAGSLIVEEAGGYVSDPTGDPLIIKSGNIIAGNVRAFKFLLRSIQKIQI